MAKNELDPVDLIGVFLTAYFGPMGLGVVTYEINIFGGFDFTAAIFSSSEIALSWAAVLALVGVLEITVMNFVLGDWDLGTIELYRLIPMVIGFAIIPLYIFVPIVTNAVNDYDSLALFLSAVQVAVGPLLSYEG